MSRRRHGNIIEWSGKDEEIRLAQKKRIESSQKPSMWEYNPKERIPLAPPSIQKHSSLFVSCLDTILQVVIKLTVEMSRRTISPARKDEKLRLAHNAKVANSQKPSMWEYNPKGGMPTELANLDSSTFLTSRLGEILCSLPKDVLIRLCSMLSPCDFFRLSLTCRLLHWRMFAFCTCYAPFTLKMSIDDKLLNGGNITSAKWIYSLYNGVIYDEKNHYEVVLRLQNQPPYNRYSEFRRGLFVCFIERFALSPYIHHSLSTGGYHN